MYRTHPPCTPGLATPERDPVRLRAARPGVYPRQFFVTDGRQISYGPGRVDQLRQSPVYVDGIKGENAAGLPVQAPTILDPKGKAIEFINKNEAFYGEAIILGKAYVAGYEPMHDAAKNVIGIYYVGYLKE
jgi:hypothetical protein